MSYIFTEDSTTAGMLDTMSNMPSVIVQLATVEGNMDKIEFSEYLIYRKIFCQKLVECGIFPLYFVTFRTVSGMNGWIYINFLLCVIYLRNVRIRPNSYNLCVRARGVIGVVSIISDYKFDIIINEKNEVLILITFQ